jgi:hypothetical protein
MSVFFRKSAKIGPVRLNFSKHGVGVSAGVKGLRVGVNAKGQRYMSGGGGGLYFRENLSSNNKQIAQTTITTSSTTNDSTNLLIGLFVISLLISLAFPIFLVATSILLLLLVAPILYNKNIVKKIAAFNKNLQDLLNNDNFAEVKKELQNIKSITGNKEKQQGIFLDIYSMFMAKVFNDNIISNEEEELIKFFNSIIPSGEIVFRNIEIINEVLQMITADEIVTKDEEEMIIKCISLLNLKDLEDEIKNVINDYKGLESFRTDGLLIIKPSLNISDTSDCYYENDCIIKKTKTTKGVMDVIDDTSGKIIITAENLHIIGNGHKKIKMKTVINVGSYSKNNIIEMIIDGRKTPFYFSVNNPITVLAILKALIS